jgi:hypothetical protein
MEPGDTATCNFQVDYNGTLPAYIGAEASGTGALTSELSFTINSISQGSTPVVIGDSSSSGGGPYTATVAYTLSSSAGNTYQNATAVVTVTFYAVQCSNNWAGGTQYANEQCAAPGPASWLQSGVSATSGNILNNIQYFTVDPGSASGGPGGFCRSTSPIASTTLAVGGTETQSSGSGGVSLSINGAGGYADNGFYESIGTVGSLNGYIIDGGGANFGTNLYFLTNSDGNFFQWSNGCLTTDGVTTYALGPTSSSGNLTVTGSSSFTTNSGGGPACTLAQLNTGADSSIPIGTPVAVWIGITESTATTAAPASLSATFTYAATS